jgi:hypothetical protein
VHGDHAPLAAEVDDPLHERQLDDRAGRVVREREHEHARWLGPPDVVGRGEAREELLREALALLRWASERIGTCRRSAPANSGP